ncbi:glycoside hydrolase family 79 protein [Aaosphaeria arxii CBS 175.79]|uniref:Glycoside hydrolase family 79 protein n=1 Tax=Aaosphaeria arxii CBS 175.79 TaxID=1450172 RepID=A0A6A5XRQ8_9PLEO|nr:glycoside hydrolase family 79 protein [Aaosphaeria arxii CBS 175.79]KAF2015862.1 glycoside hydrolase family 79 protein [Aaosphaeria arxii CBS 175.79]
MLSLQFLLLITTNPWGVFASSPTLDSSEILPKKLASYGSSENGSILVPPNGAKAGAPVLKSFISYSIELVFFPDFAGNKANPNTFSDTLLSNLGNIQGTKPHIRVGGNTQDYAVFNASLETATYGIYIPEISEDYPRILSIGPSFFESYEAWSPDVKFIHGFNLARNTSADVKSVIDSVPYACKAIGQNNILFWEIGNEPDLFKTSSQGVMRPPSWNESDYVREWEGRINGVKAALKEHCGETWMSKERFKWIAPSFAGTKNSLNSTKTWIAGLDEHGEVAQFSSHNYMGGATQPGVTLSGYLMNHTRVVASVGSHNKEHEILASVGMELDYILGEHNSLYNQGAPGLSNSFGAALWGVDFNLYAASTSIRQVYMHMGTDYRYASWQPITSNKTIIGTKAPYYGNVAVASALGDITQGSVRVQNIDLKSENDAAYAIYGSEKLKRIMVVNLHQYNFSVPEPARRPSSAYNFTLPTSCAGSGTVQRLMANGSDAITGITFNGFSYNYELDGGKPVLLGNVTKDEKVIVGADGQVTIQVPWSSGALLQLTC